MEGGVSRAKSRSLPGQVIRRRIRSIPALSEIAARRCPVRRRPATRDSAFAKRAKTKLACESGAEAPSARSVPASAVRSIRMRFTYSRTWSPPRLQPFHGKSERRARHGIGSASGPKPMNDPRRSGGIADSQSRQAPRFGHAIARRRRSATRARLSQVLIGKVAVGKVRQ